MPLADVLSALRELILDEPVIPATVAARLACYEKMFPRLSPVEREDLALIEPRQFRTYTGTIFAGERSVLVRRFPVTFSLLESRWEETFSKSFNRVELIKSVHAFRPWQNNKTTGLAKAFVDYLCTSREDLRALYPHLSDVVRLEYRSMIIARVRDPELPAILTEEELSALTVQELMECECSKASNVRCLRFEYDVLEYRKKFFGTERRLPDEITPRIVFCTGSRNRFAAVRWLEVSESVYLFLKDLDTGAYVPVAALAEAVIAGLAEPAEHEEELFRQFFAVYLDLVRAGTIFPVRP
jgi:hypothetical protein